MFRAETKYFPFKVMLRGRKAANFTISGARTKYLLYLIRKKKISFDLFWMQATDNVLLVAVVHHFMNLFDNLLRFSNILYFPLWLIHFSPNRTSYVCGYYQWALKGHCSVIFFDLGPLNAVIVRTKPGRFGVYGEEAINAADCSKPGL